MPAKPTLLPEMETQLLVEFGERLRKARQRRRLTALAVADEAGISRVTLHRAERGEPAVTMGTYLHVMRVLGLSTDLALLARDDKVGRGMQDERLPPRRIQVAASTGRRAPIVRVRLDRYPQLKQIAWSLDPTSELAPEEAFELYERNWRHVDTDAMGPAEKALLKELTATVGKGVLLV